MKTAKLGSLHLNDFWKGFIIATLTAFLTAAYQVVSTGSFNFNWSAIGTTTATAAIAYILKQMATNSNGEFLKKENETEQQ